MQTSCITRYESLFSSNNFDLTFESKLTIMLFEFELALTAIEPFIDELFYWICGITVFEGIQACM